MFKLIQQLCDNEDAIYTVCLQMKYNKLLCNAF